ncbi:MAG: hypothetical protein RRA92_01870 [Gemmatimonadota bacterium]|nr:hypothetical protein [Gemmatimonadota bacterium]
MAERLRARPAAYAGLTLVLSAAAWLTARAAGAPPGPMAAGLGLAWTLQVLGFARLAGALASGGAVAGAWVGGMAVRFAGLAALWLASVVVGGTVRVTALAYAFSLVGFLLIEAGWLAVAARPARQTDEGRG